ncbi:CCA tRNA nucleotidyltransferase [Pararhodobacter sp.]|uniref:CCA tRNA nucleotidyltransferase n=1 Tax=Pararhodobacter sp. TaxID=2127056 RepID=UPI002FDDB8B8
MKVSGDWLRSAATQSVLAMLSDAGYHALCVGGCVRNALLAAPVADVDIATDALPETVTNLAEKAGFRAVPTGIEHGTVTIVAEGTGFEVTTFRHDVETFGRHARVAFSADLAQDAARRDFTMNALYAQADGTVIDPIGGLEDIAARRVRFVGTPEDRIQEDYLRILRFFRFHAQYGDPDQGLDADALAACALHSAMLETLSRERIGAEMRKLLAAKDPAPAVAAMQACGVLGHILPGADGRALPVLVHLEAGAAGGWLRRLAVLGGEEVPDGLRLSRNELRDFSHIRDGLSSLATPAELGYRLKEVLATDIVLARAALMGMPPPDAWQDAIATGAHARFPLRPADLMPALQGPALGSALKRAEAHWIASGFTADRETLKDLCAG